jgi:hypothetical protein
MERLSITFPSARHGATRHFTLPFIPSISATGLQGSSRSPGRWPEKQSRPASPGEESPRRGGHRPMTAAAAPQYPRHGRLPPGHLRTRGLGRQADTERPLGHARGECTRLKVSTAWRCGSAACRTKTPTKGRRDGSIADDYWLPRRCLAEKRLQVPFAYVDNVFEVDAIHERPFQAWRTYCVRSGTSVPPEFMWEKSTEPEND